jgi:hypothetical protein
MNNLLAQNPFGQVQPPPGVIKYAGGTVQGVPIFVNILIKTLIVAAGVYALFNIILAGYSFLSAGGDSKRVEAAWARIWQSILGVAFVAGSFAIAAIIGQLVFGDADALLQLQIFTP